MCQVVETVEDDSGRMPGMLRTSKKFNFDVLVKNGVQIMEQFANIGDKISLRGQLTYN